MHEILFLRQTFYELQQSEMAGWWKMMLMMKKSGAPGSRIMKELHGKHLYVVVDG